MKRMFAIVGLMLLMASVAFGQYKVVRGRVIPKNSLDWRVFRDRIEVQAAGPNVIIVRTFKMEGKDGNIGRGVHTAGHSEQKIYMEAFVLTNYPGSGGFKIGDEIHGPIMALSVGEWKNRLQLYDYGTEYVPKAAPPKHTGTNGVTTTGDDPKKIDPGAAATFKFHLQKAKAGEVGSQLRVGQLYLEGKGVLQDTNQAVMWFEKAKAQGSEEAADELKNLGK